MKVLVEILEGYKTASFSGGVQKMNVLTTVLRKTYCSSVFKHSDENSLLFLYLQFTFLWRLYNGVRTGFIGSDTANLVIIETG